MVDLLDLEAPGVTAIKGQSDEDAVVDRRTRPATRLQVLKVLVSIGNQVETFWAGGAKWRVGGVTWYLHYCGSSFTSTLDWRTRALLDLQIKENQRDWNFSAVLNYF